MAADSPGQWGFRCSDVCHVTASVTNVRLGGAERDRLVSRP